MKSYSFYLFLMAFCCMACGYTTKRKAEQEIPGKVIQKIGSDQQKSHFYLKTRPDSALHFAREGLLMAKKWSYLPGEARMLCSLAAINEEYSNYSLAIVYQKQAIPLFNKSGYRKELAGAYLQLGLLQAKQGEINPALEAMRSGLRLYTLMADTSGLIKSYMNLGEVYELNHQLDQATKFYVQAEQLNKDKPVSDDYFNLLNHLGKLHTKKGDHQQALAYYKIGVAKSDDPNFNKYHVRFLQKTGKVLDSLGRKREALDYHRKGLEKAKKLNLREEEARSLLNLAKSVKEEDAQESVLHLRNALSIARSIGNKQLSAEIYQSLSDLYKQQSRYSEALNSLEEHHRLIDSLVNADKANRLSVLQSSYKIAESRVRIEDLELVNQERTYERNIGIGVAVAALLILLILWFYFYKIHQLNRRLEESNMVKDKLFSIIGHDLRNPIGGITQLLAVMDEEKLNQEDLQQMISAMRKQGDITLEILNALLNWGEAQIKGIHVKASAFNPELVVRKNIEALQKQIEDKELLVINLVPATLNITADPNHFDFIIRNLVSNAIKFSPVQGKIEVKADVENTGRVLFSVKDEGKGISKEQQDLFLKSNMDISYGTRGEKGTGIGLMLCKEFVKSNQGKIWIESEPGKGSTFYFYVN
ncbi:tetratricopeptide repeat-containing sensor histidine kinase [Pedobacter sp.]|uniref:tetratricopeptide repeat-containing sensor histidine kinase n=1 Tax=Pedobacter sp. TaxID=1411316 RepID=UPI002C0CD855|nr:ATP-binding protein [Pedobacter sp.]HWW39979.1 ATP-binding protein [Pedobacter sp.]